MDRSAPAEVEAAQEGVSEAAAAASEAAREVIRARQRAYLKKRRAEDPVWAAHKREINRVHRMAHYHRNKEAILAAQHSAALERGGGVARPGPRRKPCPAPATASVGDVTSSRQ